MRIPFYIYTFWCVLNLDLAAWSSPVGTAVRVRAPLGIPEDRVIQHIRRDIAIASVSKRSQPYKVNTTFDHTWSNAVLLQL